MAVDPFADSQGNIATGTQIADIGTLAAMATEKMAEIEKIESALTEKKIELNIILHRDLPDAMDAANCKEFTTADGRKLTVKSVVAASIPAARLTEAMQWLRDNGHEGLIKHMITIAVDRGKDNIVPAIITQVQNDYGVNADDKSVVHPQTLAAFCREQLAEGKELPAELLGLYVNRIVQIK